MGLGKRSVMHTVAELCRTQSIKRLTESVYLEERGALCCLSQLLTGLLIS